MAQRSNSFPRDSFTLTVALLSSLAANLTADDSANRVEFNRDIRPILSDVCFQCHGPDTQQRKADLRLDAESQLFADRDGHRVLVPGDPAKSELFRRVSSTDRDEQMPPPSSGKHLSVEQIATLKRWIEQGAKWQGHWAFHPPQAKAPRNNVSAGHPIDSFILDRLRREKLTLSPAADKAMLLRRVTLDLIGLPPSVDEIDDFLEDDSPDAYEKVVDRLLASPRFGERFARPWLDGARYADTSGYQSDGERSMWRWRDWVIDALNADKPFDEFTVEQIAGDLLPKGTLDQVLATGFHRNHRGNAEGGIIPEEYAVEYVVDRVDTTATVWLGLTLGCCRCHDHKFDPFSQREYYQLFAFFNNVPEKGRAIKFGNSPPFVKTPTREQQRLLQDLVQERDRLSLKGEAPLLAFQEWERTLRSQPSREGEELEWTVTRGEVLRLPFDADAQPVVRPNRKPAFAQAQPQPLGPNSGPPKLNEADQAAVVFGEGRMGRAAVFDGQRRLAVGDIANIGFHDKFSISAWIHADAESGTILSRMSDDANSDGYNLCLDHGKLQLNLVKRWLDDALRVESELPIPTGQWVHVAVTCDGSRFAEGVNLFVNGLRVPKRIVLDELNQAFASKDVFRVGFGGLTPPFRGRIDEVRLFDALLSSEEIQILSVPETITRILALSPESVSKSQLAKMRACFHSEYAPPENRTPYLRVHQLNDVMERLTDSFPTTMVMQELPKPRDAQVLIRGAYDRPGDVVLPDYPTALAVTSWKDRHGSRPSRLDLAHWIVASDNPLTARVTVNRFWQQLFGNGLVKTVDDFGSQGDWPSHPELLDWLAVELMGEGVPGSTAAAHRPLVSRSLSPLAWSIKRLIRSLITSATYRQTSRASAELLASDPENRLLARGPRSRLSAETVRDQALAASGLLTEQLGGPSIKPYQPEGLWDDLQNTEKYVQDHGPALYRRGLYVFWKRTIAPPVMVTFDAAARETCFVRETRTNTPLQALTLLNETSFVEAARLMAERVLRAASLDTDSRMRLAFRLVLTRQPTDRELTVLRRGLDQHRLQYREHPESAAQMLKTGEFPADQQLAPAELAAWTAVCGLILNLDEAVTKE